MPTTLAFVTFLIGCGLFVYFVLNRKGKGGSSYNFIKKDLQGLLEEAKNQKATFERFLDEAQNISDALKYSINEAKRFDESLRAYKDCVLEAEKMLKHGISEIKSKASEFFDRVEDFKRQLDEYSRSILVEKSKLLLRSSNQPPKPSKTSTKIVLERQNFDIDVETIKPNSTGVDPLRSDPRLGVLGNSRQF